MALGTIQRVYQREGRSKPGAVVFSDGKKFSTFEDAPISAALKGIGQLAEYTTESNGQYVNLKTLVLKGAAPAAQPSEPARGTDLYPPPLAWAIHDLAAAVRELTSWVGRKPPLYVVQPGQAPVAVPEPEQPAVDSIADIQDRLGKAINSSEAAEAMFAALRAKHKSPEKLLAAATDLLKAHGVDDSNSDELPF